MLNERLKNTLRGEEDSEMTRHRFGPQMVK